MLDQGADEPQKSDQARTALVATAAALVALAVLGPLIAADALLNLDLVVFDREWFRPGFFGLGPELPRNTPQGAVFSLLTMLVPGPMVFGFFFIASIAGATAGMYRLCRRVEPLAAVGAAFLYGASPFVFTRASVGHLTMVTAAAILPWVIPTLLEPARSRQATFLAAAALGFTGFYGGLLVVLLVGVGMLHEPVRGWFATAGVAIAAQLPWLLPGLIVIRQSPSLAGGADFPSGIDGLTDAIRLIVGHGFFRPDLQVGAERSGLALLASVVVVGLVMVGLRSSGRRRAMTSLASGGSDDEAVWRRRLGPAAGLAAVLIVASLSPFDAAYDRVTDWTVGAPLREPHRLLIVVLAFVAVTVANGADSLARRAPPALAGFSASLPGVVALVLATPALWGFGGRVEPVDMPREWHEARDVVHADVAPVLALPWHRYFYSSTLSGTAVLNPVGRWLGGDVLSSPDVGLGNPTAERVDPRVPTIEALLDRVADSGAFVADDLAAAGIGWVVILPEADYDSFLTMTVDPGMEPVVVGNTLELYRVRAYVGPAVSSTGQSIGVDETLPFLATVDAGGTWNHAWAPGWAQGWSSLDRSDDGRIVVTDSGKMWYWPSVAVVAVDLFCLGIVIAALARQRRIRRTCSIPSNR